MKADVQDESPRRKFGTADAMILIAATAIGLAWVRANHAADANLRVASPYLDLFSWFVKSRFEKTWISFRLCHSLAIAWMTALLISRLRRPRPDLGHLTDQPGCVACLAAVLVFGVEIARAWTLTVREIVRHDWATEAHGHHHRFLWSETILPQVVPTEPGLAVAAVWVLLILGGRWRPQPDWIDRTGRAFGLFWIVWWVVEEVAPWDFLDKDPYIKLPTR